MCGIAGVVSFSSPISPHWLEAVLRGLSHRGPDQCGTAMYPCCLLGCRRFAIVGGDAGRQPVESPTRDSALVFNGEIYNFREFVGFLRRRGHSISGKSDSEVLLPLYRELGAAFLTELDGMFALALWDQRNETLLLARDRFGMKPLYVRRSRDRVEFASELTALCDAMDTPPEVDVDAIAFQLSLTGIPAPYCAVAGVEKVQEGHYLTFSRSLQQKSRFARLSYVPVGHGDPAHWRSRLHEELTAAVASCCPTDQPVVAFLSGGLDSSLICKLAKERLNGRLSCLTVGFRPLDTLAPYHFPHGFERAEEVHNEFAEAAETAAELEIPHSLVALTEDDFLTFLDRVAWLDEPCGSLSSVPYFFVSEVAARRARVCLTGEGADEIFGGYSYFSPSMYGPPGTDLGRRYVELRSIFEPRELRQLLRSPSQGESVEVFAEREVASEFDGDHRDVTSVVSFLEIRVTLPNNLLQKHDRLGMRWPIEARYPFLRRRIADLGLQMPARLKVGARFGKVLLRALAKTARVPRGAIVRRKVRLSAPYEALFEQPSLRERVLEILLDARTLERGIVAPDYVSRLVACRGSFRRWAHKVWALVILELWARRVLDRERDASA